MPSPSAPNAYPSVAYPGLTNAAPPSLARPVFVAGTSAFAAVPQQSAVDLTSAVFTPNVGELLIVHVGTSSPACAIRAVAGGALEWSRRARVDPQSGQAAGQTWTAYVGANRNTPMTVSATVASINATTSERAGMTVQRWSNASTAIPANTTVRPGSASGLAVLAAGTRGAAVSWACFDANGAVGTVDYYGGAVAASPSSQVPQQLGCYFGWQTVNSPSAMTFGVGSPTGMAATLTAIELLPIALTPTATLIESFTDDFAGPQFNPRWTSITSG